MQARRRPTVRRDYASVGAVCSQERCRYPQYLLRLVERALIDRERRATERRIKAAQFPVLKTIDRFDFKAQPALNEPLVRELLRGEYIAKKEHLLLVGNPGPGKPHPAGALGLAAGSQGQRVRFYTTTGLVPQLLEARAERTLQRLQKPLERQDRLLLAELGYVPCSKAGAELRFDVAGRAYERTSLIVTTNLPFEQWTEVLGRERLTGGHAGPPDAPRAYPGSQRPKRPAGRRQTPAQAPTAGAGKTLARPPRPSPTAPATRGARLFSWAWPVRGAWRPAATRTGGSQSVAAAGPPTKIDGAAARLVGPEVPAGNARHWPSHPHSSVAA